MNKENPTQHRMTRRAAAHDYTRPGIYHITMHVADCLGQPLGAVVGDLNAPDGSANAPRVALSAAGKMVEHELLTAIHAHYPMVTVQEHVIMPDHLHCLMVVSDRIISKNGKVRSLGDIITGFKVGCNRQYWEMQGMQRTNPAATLSVSGGSIAGGEIASHTAPSGLPTTAPAAKPQETLSVIGGYGDGQTAFHTVPSGLPAGYKVPSWGSTARQPLFEGGYCDVMPIDARQLETQRAYIKGNPRSRLLRMSHRAWLSVQRGAITTALTPSALHGYLQRECAAHQATPEALAAIEGRLLIAGVKTAGHSAPSGRFISCDTFGNRALLTEHRCLPVVCHRKDAKRYEEQKQRCLEEAAQGAVLVSACISPKEREIINESVNRGFATITIHDNGFSDRYHPSEERLGLCAEGRLLLVTPWVYQYRGKEEQVTVPFCKAMNCVVQALCSTKDSWWKVCS